MAVESGSLSSRTLRSNFVWFAATFAVNHGVVTTPLVISTSILEKNVAYTGNALLNVFTMISALFFGAPLVSCVGLKGGILFGMLFYCIYCSFFSLATFGSQEGWGVDLQWMLFCGGSSCGGIAAGVLWTAQGGYMTRTVDLILSGEPQTERQKLSAELSSTFALLYLGVEVAAKLLWSVLDTWGLVKWHIAALYAGFGAIALLLMATGAQRLEVSGAAAGPDWTSKFVAAVKLWKDPCIFLLAGSNLTFGFCAAFMNGYVNGTYAKKLGTFAPTLLAAVTTLTAASLSPILGYAGAKVGKKLFVLIGACCFGTIPVAMLTGSCVSCWGWWLAVLYLLQGSGRAVYESTNKGVFVDFFPEPNSIGAFANVMLQSSAAFAISFFLSQELTERMLASIVILLALFTPIGYCAAEALRARQSRSPPLLAG